MSTCDKSKGLPWEEAAEVRDNITGWVCKTCRHFWGDGPSGERAARYCCASDAPCDCGKRRSKHYALCDDCREKRSAEEYGALEEVEWNGETPLVDYNGDHYCWDADDLADFLDNCEFDYLLQPPLGVDEWEPSPEQYLEVAINHVRLCLCRKEKPPHFDLLDMLVDYDDDADLDAEGLAAEKVVNEWLAKYRPMWTQTNKRPSLKSLRKHLDLPERNDSEGGAAK